jgi:hypothetical protein
MSAEEIGRGADRFGSMGSEATQDLHGGGPHDWPVEFWVPDSGWISWEALTPESSAKATRFSEFRAQSDPPVSRWRGGYEGARLAHAVALYDFPPGPRDDPAMYEVMSDVVASGEIEPVDSFRNGHRLFRRRPDQEPETDGESPRGTALKEPRNQVIPS